MLEHVTRKDPEYEFIRSQWRRFITNACADCEIEAPTADEWKALEEYHPRKPIVVIIYRLLKLRGKV